MFNNKIPKFLNYENTPRFKLTLAISCSLFIYLFLIFFQPFGVNNYRPSEVIPLDLALGLLFIIPTIFIIIIFNEFVLRSRINFDDNVYIYLFWFLYMFISIGSGSFLLYNYLGEFHDFSFSSYIKHLIEIGTVLIFPFFGTLFFYSFQSITQNYAEVLSVSNNKSDIDDVILIKGDYKHGEIALRKNAIISIQSEDNYLSIKYLEKEEVKKYLIRSTLTKIEMLLDSELFVRCNRSIIVNLYHLESIKRPSSKVELKLKYIDDSIKVSKSNIKKVLESTEKYYTSNQ